MTARLLLLGRRLVVAAPLVGLLGVSACGSGGESNASNEIAMRLISFRPKALTVQTGTSVTWKQQDAGFHTATSGTVSKEASGSTNTNPDGTFESGQLAKGKEFSFTFAEGGTYEYFCEVHPATMTGRVTAE